MRKDITIAAETRTTRGKNEARRLRVQSLIPAVVYGTGKDPVAVSVSPKEVNKILHSASGANTIFNVEIKDGEVTPVMVVDWQHDPIKNNLLHIDMLRIDLAKTIKVKVPVHTTGEPVGVKVQGGLYELINRDIEIECLPDDIPESFVVDIAAMSVNQSLRANEIPLTASMKLASKPEMVISHVVATRGTDEAAEAEKGNEPEVIKKGKKEEK